MAKYTQANRLMQITTPFDDDYLLVNRMTVTEGISQLFSMEVELLHEEKEGWTIPEVVDVQKLLGQGVSIKISQRDKGGRVFSGMVSEFSQGSRGIKFTQYWITVVPNVWILTQNKQSRIFQQKTVPSILKDVFKGFENVMSLETEYEYKPRNYCVQYRESDFDFASRLMEEEGIYYFFEHTDDGAHKMIISDRPRFTRDCPGKNEITYSHIATKEEFASSIIEWGTDYKLGTGQVSFRDHHIQQPGKNLASTTPTKFEIGGNKTWEIYDYPGGYARKFDGIEPQGTERADLDNIVPDGKRTAEIAMAVIDAQYMMGDGRSDCASFTSGHRFKMNSHPIKDLNGEYVLTSVSHTAVQSPPYEGEGDENVDTYINSFKALSHGRPGAAPYRPVQKTEKPVVYGSQTALVVGSGDEEIYTDPYGRIKVQFYWDRHGQGDGLDSCWLPVAQAWAGNNWGSMFIPRVGMEVLVHFLEGDADQPIVTGCVYHPGNMPPYKLPEHKTKSTLKSNSTKGGKGFNEFRFEDKKGEEQIFMHGQKDLDIRIKNTRRELIGNDRHLIVWRDKKELIKRDKHIIVDKDLKVSIGKEKDGNYSRYVKKDVYLETGGSMSQDIGGSLGELIGGPHTEDAEQYYLRTSKSIILEAGTQLTIKCGASFIDIGPAGISIVGSPLVNINSGGSPGMDQSLAIILPEEPDKANTADKADPGSDAPTYKNEISKIPEHKLPYYKNPTHNPNENKDKKSWIAIELKDELGNPVPGQQYRVTLPDGRTIAQGTLDRDGFAKVSNIDPGSCKVTFPNLDKDVWEDA